MPEEKKEASVMRKKWFEYVRKIRKKLSRQRKEPVSHRDAMREASQSWAAEKEKILKRIAREERRKARET